MIHPAGPTDENRNTIHTESGTKEKSSSKKQEIQRGKIANTNK
jgi:hypothetical protein